MDKGCILRIFPDKLEGSKTSLILKDTKTEASCRTIFMTAALREELKQWLERLKREEALDPERYRNTSLGIVWEKFPKFIIGFVAASLVFSVLQGNGLFTADARGKLAEPGVAKMFSTVFFSLAFVCVGLDTRLKDIVSRENRNLLWAFLAAQAFNIVVTFLIALVLFGVLKPMLG